MTNFSDMLSKAKAMQEKMKEAQDQIKKIQVEGVSGGNLVKVTLAGDYELKSIEITEAAKKESQEIINDLIIAAYNNAKENLKKKSFKLPILSNGTPELLNHLVKSSDLENLFDDIFSVEEVKIYKPDPKVYDIPVNKYKVSKGEITFLSANTWDVSGAGNYGYNSIWVNRNNSVFDKLYYKPKNDVKNLKQLLYLKWEI